MNNMRLLTPYGQWTEEGRKLATRLTSLLKPIVEEACEQYDVGDVIALTRDICRLEIAFAGLHKKHRAERE